MAILLILSYTSVSFVILYSTGSTAINGVTVEIYYVCITGLPLLILGAALLLQVMIALSGMRGVKILTWSSSSLDWTAALVHHMQLTPIPFRCIRPVSDMDVHGGPARPSETQPSAWHAHPSIRKVILSLWGLVAACVVWAAATTLIWNLTVRADSSAPKGSWSLLPGSSSEQLGWMFRMTGNVTVQWWILSYISVALVQGALTLGLHCSELVANVIRDERQWRCATGRKGLRMTTNPLKSFFTNPLGLVLFVAKFVLHWMFGLSYSLSSGGDIADRMVSTVWISMYTTQIWNLCIALFIFASFFTLIARFRPRGPQPAAYGHLQTLANLVDEWSPVMWWGHKEDGIPYCHAGTSDHLLPAVKMDCVYAGPSVGSHPSVSPLGCDLKD
ncbi:hypothetical protein M405DRAFT_485269 [Rhizopogon salebrosus TDB-379]|nr:hypothetical protein M405DRAFT_485269 [Rhizopogon salebrosus TDB-379]